MNKKLLKTTVGPSALLIGFGIVLAMSAQAAQRTSGMVNYFADNGFGAPVKTMQHPSGEFYRGVTYVAYQGSLEDPYVAAYDHATGTWSGPFKAGESVLGKNPDAKIDNHGKPAMVIDEAGTIHLVFGGHGGLPMYGENPLGNTHTGRMIHVVTKNPLDVSSWKVLDNIPPFGTYNQFVKMDNGDIYLFYRHGGHRSNWVYQRSTDNGRSFAPPVSVLKTKRSSGPSAHDAWYAWFVRGQGHEIIAGYNYHLCRVLGHNSERHNGYYMVMDTTDHSWRNVKGEELSVPVTKEQADSMTLVVDTRDLWSHRGTVAQDSAGTPHATFHVGDPRPLKKGSPKQMYYYRWTGKAWSVGGGAALPQGCDGDMVISSPTEVSLLLQHKEEGTGEIAWWHSIDGGQSFDKGDVLLRRQDTRFLISSIIRSAHPDARIVAMGKTGESDFGKMYLLGDHGAIKRSKPEADQRDD